MLATEVDPVTLAVVEALDTLLGVVTAELIAGGEGLGALVSYASNTFDANGVFAVLLLLVVVASLLSGIMTGIERRLMRWRA